MEVQTRKRSAVFSSEKPLAQKIIFESENDGLGRDVPGAVPFFATPFTASTAYILPVPVVKRPRLSTPEQTEGIGAIELEENIRTAQDPPLEGGGGGVVRIDKAPEGGSTAWWNGSWLGLDRRRGESARAGCGGAQSSEQQAAAEKTGRGKALVQLRIDDMFSIGAPKQAAEPARATGAMDVDSVNAETGPPCYVCTGELEAEGGDILCSFCDRAACDKCWQNCFACKVPHCSLCLTADFSSQFECYFCPTCYQDKRREECGGDSDSMD